MTAEPLPEGARGHSWYQEGHPTPAWPYILLGLGLLGVGIAAWRPIPVGVWHDDGVYMLVGKAIAAGHGFVYDGVAGTPPAAKFPPLYPIMLAVLWKLFGGIGPVTFAATMLNIGLLAGAGAMFAKALHRATGLSLRMSIAAAALGFASTDLIRTALVLLSEATFMLLTSAALLTWTYIRPGGETQTAPSKSDGSVATTPPYPLGLCAGLAALLVALVLVRTAGVVLVLAVMLAVLIDRSGRVPLSTRVGLAGALTLPAMLATWAWGRWADEASEAIPEGARDLLGPYGSWLADQALSSPATFAGALPGQVAGLLTRAAGIFVPGLEGGALWLVVVLAAPLALLGIWEMLRRFPPLGWFTLGYMAMLILWPYLDRRLVAPWHPALVASVALGASTLIARVSNDRIEKAVITAAAIWVTAFTTMTAFRIADGWTTAPYRLRAERLAASVEALSRTVPPDAVVGAPEFWAALHLHGGWTVAPSVRFDPRSVDPEAPMWGTPEEQIELWTTTGIDHLLLEQAGQLHGATLDQLEAACPGTVFVLAQMAGSAVVRLDWSSDCGRDPAR
jgi:hypothetical protein